MDENTPTQKLPFAILQQNLKQRNREVWHCRKHGSQNMVHILLCGCKMYRCIKHQSMSCSLKPKLYSGAKALWIRSQWNTHKDFWILFPTEGWLHPNQQMTMLVIVRKHFGTPKLWKTELKWGDYFCVQRTPEDCVSAQAAILIWWCKKAFNVRDRQTLIVCIH